MPGVFVPGANQGSEASASLTARKGFSLRPEYAESATETELPWRQGRWNAVNPASEKPKFGRGTVPKEMNGGTDGGCKLP